MDAVATRRSAFAMSTAIGATTVILLGLLVASVAVGRSISPLGASATREIKVIGHQWWWEVQYSDPVASNTIIDANEIHLPVGERVLLQLSSRDVIHSLWIPSLQGKRDLIPGKDTTLVIRADKPGLYRAQCAEFCGFQHAKMALVVVVEPRAKFSAWAEAARKPARKPQSLDEQRGAQLFMSTSCALCHAIAGAEAGSRVGPDLTHFGSRRTIGAASIPNTAANLAGWIVNPQHIKPGAIMPPNNYEPGDLHALVAYLESLK
jgi:cytochrome c oxidase subunit 2